jgi:4-aminobutyrate aminotransferase
MIKIGKKANDVIRRDKKVFLSTTRVPYPLVVERGEGDFVYDIEGNRYIDFTSFIAVYNLGINARAQEREAIKRQVDKLMHPAFLDFYSELPVTFGERLLTMFPKGFGKLFLSNSGTEANEAAIKFSNIFTKRPYTMAFYNAFHGRTKGSLSLTNSRVVQRQGFGPFNTTIHVPFPYCYRCPLKMKYPDCGIACIDFIKDYPLKREVAPEEVAAFFIEPIQGEGGYVVPPPDYYKELKKLLDEHGILLVADEVQSGYMRTGKFLALDNFGVTADIYTMAKAIGGGVPLGVTVTSNALGDIPPGSHANTFGGNLLAMAAGMESLKYVIKHKRDLEHDIKQKGKYSLKRLKSMENRYEIVGDARGMGLMLAIELVRSKRTKVPAVKEREEIVKECFYNGLTLLEAGDSTIRIAPPVTIDQRNLENGLDILENAVRKINIKMMSK